MPKILAESTAVDADIERRIARRLARLRAERKLSLEALAERTGISRATLSRLERAELSPTAAMLGKLCSVYGWTLSRFMAEAETRAPSLVPARDQTEWKDPGSGYRRRVVSPPAPELRGELVEVRMPPGATVSFDTAPIPGLEHHLWLHRRHTHPRSRGRAILAARRRLPALPARRADAVQESRQARGALSRRDGAAVSAAEGVRIEEWHPDGDCASDLDALADVLHAVVYDGAGVSFVVPFSRDEARAFWSDKVLPGVRARTPPRRRGPNRRADCRHGADRSCDAAEPAASRRGPEAARPSVGSPPGNRSRADDRYRGRRGGRRPDAAHARYVDRPSRRARYTASVNYW